jgi:hypothetical protein
VRNLLLNSLLVLILTGCSVVLHTGLRKLQDNEQKALAYTPFRMDTSMTYKYKGALDIYKYHLSGIFLIKPQPENTYRVIFLSELGMKIFDFAISRDSIHYFYCIGSLNRPAIIQTLQKDFDLLFLYEFRGFEKFDKRDYFNYKNTEIKVIRYLTGRKKNYYFINEPTLHMIKLESASGMVLKTRIYLLEYDRDLARKILIQNKDIKLKISMEYYN